VKLIVLPTAVVCLSCNSMAAWGWQLIILAQTMADRASYTSRDLELDKVATAHCKIAFRSGADLIATAILHGECATHNDANLQEAFLTVLNAISHKGTTCVCESSNNFLFHFPTAKPERVCEPTVCAGIVLDMLRSATVEKADCTNCPAGLRLEQFATPANVILGSPCQDSATQETQEEEIEEDVNEDITEEHMQAPSTFKPKFNEWGVKPIRIFRGNAAVYLDVLQIVNDYRSVWGCDPPSPHHPKYEELRAKCEQYKGLWELLQRLNPRSRKCYNFGLCYEGLGHVSEKKIIVGQVKLKAGTPIVDYDDCGCCTLHPRDKIASITMQVNGKDKDFKENTFESYGLLGMGHNQCRDGAATKGHIWQTCMSVPEFFKELKVSAIGSWLSVQKISTCEKKIAENLREKKYDHFESEAQLKKAAEKMAKLWGKTKRTKRRA